MSESLKSIRFSLLTLGCKVNSYESDAITKMLTDAGAVPVPFTEPADVCIINSCSVTNIADRKSRQMLHRARTKNPDAIIVATGCYAQIGGEGLIEDGDADIVVGNSVKSQIVSMIAEAVEKGKKLSCRVEDLSTCKNYECMTISECSERSRAFIKIEDGCNQFCSYCIIPYARGRVRSRSEISICTEIEQLAEKGYREVVLTGIHLSSYGNEKYENAGVFNYAPLLNLIKKVAEIPGIERIRLGSLEPRIITAEFAESLSAVEKFCPHFHLSLQSGSSATLKRMNRHYSPEEFLEKCEILRKYFDNPAITTDVIAGFAGESDEEFEECCDFVLRARFAKMHIFKYSRRKGTAADKMPGQVPEEIKHSRSERLMEIDRLMHEEYRDLFCGKNDFVLIESEKKIKGKSYYTGLNSRYLGIAVPAEVFSSSAESVINSIIELRIKGKLDDEFLEGEPV